MKIFLGLVLLLMFCSTQAQAQKKKKDKDRNLWQQYVGETSPSGWRVNVIAPDPDDHGPDGFNAYDWDGDGDLDVMVNYEEGQYSRLYFNPGKDKVKEPWTEYIQFDHKGGSEDSGIGDLDNDGDIDYIANGGGVYFNPGKKRVKDIKAWQNIRLAHGGRCPTVADMNGDGLNDIITGGNTIYLQPKTNKTNPKNWKKIELGKTRWVMSCFALDMDHDGDQDVLIMDRRQGGTFYFANPGNRNITGEWERVTIDETLGMFMTVGDLNNDKRLDLVKTTKAGCTILLKTNDKGIPEYKKIPVPMPKQGKKAPNPKGVGIVELNTKNKTPEIMIIPEYNGQNWILVNIGKGDKANDWKTVVMDIPAPIMGKKTDNVYLADIDGDGDLDIATSEENGGWGIMWYENPLTK